LRSEKIVSARRRNEVAAATGPGISRRQSRIVIIARRSGRSTYLPGSRGEFCVRQARAAEEELVGTDWHWREKIVCARGTDYVVLVDAVAADANCADEYADAIKRETTREDGDPVRHLAAGSSSTYGTLTIVTVDFFTDDST
jgi:hypothetical protein